MLGPARRTYLICLALSIHMPTLPCPNSLVSSSALPRCSKSCWIGGTWRSPRQPPIRAAALDMKSYRQMRRACCLALNDSSIIPLCFPSHPGSPTWYEFGCLRICSPSTAACLHLLVLDTLEFHVLRD